MGTLAIRMMREDQAKVLAITIATMISTSLLYVTSMLAVTVIELFSQNGDVVSKLFLHLSKGSQPLMQDGKNMIIWSFLLLALFILLGSFAPVYNVFSISIRSKADRYRILSASGATIAQLRRVVLTEASLVGFAGVFGGILVGRVLSMVIVRVLKQPVEAVLNIRGGISVSVPPTFGMITVIAGVMLLTVFVAAMFPTVMLHDITSHQSEEEESENQREKKYHRQKDLGSNVSGVLRSLGKRYMQLHRKSYGSFALSSILSISLVVILASFLKQIERVMTVDWMSVQEQQNVEILGRILLVSVVAVMFVIEIVAVFNAISANVMEYRKDMVVFYAIGATRKELCKILETECLLYVGICTVLAIPIALLASMLINALLFGAGSWCFPWSGVISTIACMITVLLLSVIYVNIKMRQARIVETLRRFGT